MKAATPTMPGYLAICAALTWELRPLLQHLGPAERFRIGSLKAWRSRRSRPPVLIFQTGAGVESATKATETVLAAEPVGELLNTGCAGALANGLAAGAIVVATEIIGPLPESARHRAAADLVARARFAVEAAGHFAHDGAILTSREALFTAAAKRAHGERYGAVAVDMESAAVAQVAETHSIPVASLRVILDSADAELLPELFGPKPALRAALHAARAPRDGLALARLVLAKRSASSSLSDVFRHFFLSLRAG
jgi:adenosylhomocysteine nucleosidase